MGQFNIRHLRKKKGGYYWEPSASLKKIGYYSQPLGKNIAEAIKKAESWNRDADKTRKALIEPDPNYGTIAWVIRQYKKSSRFTKLRDRTQADYIYNFKIIERFAGDKPPRKLKPKLLEKWYDKMRVNSLAMANATMRVLSVLMEYAVLEELINQNPVLKIRKVTERPRRVVWEERVFDNYISMAEKENLSSIVLALWIAADTGQREADVLNLLWSQFDGRAFHFKQSKTGEEVTIPITPGLRAVMSKTKKKSPHIIISEATGRPYKGDHFRHLFAEIREKAGIDKKYQFRDLRRTAVVRLAKSKATIPQIASITGHTLKSATKILETYLPKTPELAEQAIANLVDFEAEKRKKVGTDDK